jgi:hypothetical protein
VRGALHGHECAGLAPAYSCGPDRPRGCLRHRTCGLGLFGRGETATIGVSEKT